jgi:CBS domain-containing protein
MAISNVPLETAGPSVADVMLHDPRTLAPDTTVGEARAMFENDRVRLLLLARDGTFAGAVTRESLPDDAADDDRLDALAGADFALVAPSDPVARAVELLDERDTDRLPVVDDGRLVGLVCFNRRHGHFCVDR